MKTRRVVTGHNPEGRSVIKWDSRGIFAPLACRTYGKGDFNTLSRKVELYFILLEQKR